MRYNQIFVGSQVYAQSITENFCRNTTNTIVFGLSYATVLTSFTFSDSWNYNLRSATQCFFLIFPLLLFYVCSSWTHLAFAHEISLNFCIHLSCNLCQTHSSFIVFCHWAHTHPDLCSQRYTVSVSGSSGIRALHFQTAFNFSRHHFFIPGPGSVHSKLKHFSSVLTELGLPWIRQNCSSELYS